MFEWFGKKSSQPEVSAGGSVINRYPKKDWSSGWRGSPDAAAARFGEARNAVYQRFFGEASAVSEEPLPLIPRVNVYTYHRRGPGGREVCALVTSGMSDIPMKTPSRHAVARRVELIFYCAEPRPEYVETMRWLAHFPHDQKTWIGAGHTVPNGNPPAPFWGSRILDTILFLPPIVTRDATLAEELKLDGEGVHFLWMVPLTTPECNLKLEQGLDAILDLFEKHRHPHVFDAGRASYV